VKTSSMLVVALACVGFCAGCQYGQISHMGPQSHFDFPNSNVKPLGPVKVTKMPCKAAFPTATDDLALYNAALKQVDGADLVIDYVKVIRLYGLGPFTWCEMDIEGTAAKMEIGTQKIGP
jgi:hypothetical protein